MSVIQFPDRGTQGVHIAAAMDEALNDSPPTPLEALQARVDILENDLERLCEIVDAHSEGIERQSKYLADLVALLEARFGGIIASNRKATLLFAARPEEANE